MFSVDVFQFEHCLEPIRLDVMMGELYCEHVSPIHRHLSPPHTVVRSRLH